MELELNTFHSMRAIIGSVRAILGSMSAIFASIASRLCITLYMRLCKSAKGPNVENMKVISKPFQQKPGVTLYHGNSMAPNVPDSYHAFTLNTSSLSQCHPGLLWLSTFSPIPPTSSTLLLFTVLVVFSKFGRCLVSTIPVWPLSYLGHSE